MEKLNHLADVPTEESVIAHIISNPDLYDVVKPLLDNDSFLSQPCQKLWKAINYYVGLGKTPDLPFLQAEFRDKKRTADLDNLNRIARVPTSRDIMQQIEILEVRRKRRVYHDLHVAIMENEDGDVQTLESIVSKAEERANKLTASSIVDKYGLMQHAADIINHNYATNGQCMSFMTGFRILDDMGGIPPESEVIIAAFSSQGKTAFALTLLNKAMEDGLNVALYSAEMGLSSIAGRFLNMMGWNVPIAKFKTQALFRPTIDDFNRLAGDFQSRPGGIFIDSSSTNSPDYICSSIRVLYRKYGIRVAVVDYLQLISIYDESGMSDQEKLAVASRKLQAIAKELSIVVIVLSQFSRPLKDQGHQPSEDLIRGSGQIYEACDIALYVYRPEKWENENYPVPFVDAEKQGTAMIKIGKYRDGESGKSAIVGFDGPRTLFYEFPEGKYDPDIKKNYPKTGTIPEPLPKSSPIPKQVKSATDDLPF